MKTHLIHFSGLLALLGLLSVTGQAVANPEVGADYSQTTGFFRINSSSSGSPTVLRTVTVKCPVAGFTIVHADTQFGLLFSGAVLSEGVVAYSISRNSLAFDNNHYHSLKGEAGEEEVPDSNPGAISRFDTCTAGAAVTYRFLAYRVFGLTVSTYAWQPKLSVVAYRDKY